MSVLIYLAFFVVSYFMLMMLFGYSTYRSYFVWAAPLLTGFAVLQAYALCILGLAAFFVWHLFLITAVFVWWAIKSHRQAQAISALSQGSEAMSYFAANSTSTTWLYFFLSVLTYLASFSIGFVYIFNTYFFDG